MSPKTIKLKERESRKLERAARRLRSDADKLAIEHNKYAFNSNPRAAAAWMESISIGSLSDSLNFEKNKLERISFADLKKKASIKRDYLKAVDQLEIINHKKLESKADVLLEKIKAILGDG